MSRLIHRAVHSVQPFLKWIAWRLCCHTAFEAVSGRGLSLLSSAAFQQILRAELAQNLALVRREKVGSDEFVVQRFSLFSAGRPTLGIGHRAANQGIGSCCQLRIVVV